MKALPDLSGCRSPLVWFTLLPLAPAGAVAELGLVRSHARLGFCCRTFARCMRHAASSRRDRAIRRITLRSKCV